MKKSNLLPATVFVWAALAAQAPAWAKSGVESVNLDYVALDAGLDCNRILFQSSQHFRGTVFAIPRVVGGTGTEKGRPYNITPGTQPGHFNLTISLYFPTNDEVLKKSAASTSKVDANACNWDKVKDDLNRSIKDPDARIQKVSMIPLTSIEVRLPGVAPVGIIGRNVETNEESDILDYSGKALTAEFKNITEAEKNTFQSQLVTQEGIPTSVKFRFQARSRKGSVTARINLENLAQKFSADATANGFKFLGSGELSATLKTSLTGNSVQIISEAGTDDSTSAITASLIDRVMKDISIALPDLQITDADKAKAGAGKVAVAAVVDILKTKVQSEISVNLMSAPESASAQTEIRLKADKLNDPNTIEVQLKAGDTDPSLGVVLNAGESIIVTPTSWKVETTRYTELRAYLTSSEFNSLKLAPYFPSLLNEEIKINDTRINGTLIAEGKKTVLGMTTWPNWRWVRTQQIASSFMESSNIIPPNLESLQKLPVSLSFAALGDTRLFKLGELANIQENPFFNTLYDEQTGRLIITAKQDLGVIRVRGRMNNKEDLKIAPKPIILDQVQEIYTNGFDVSKYTTTRILKQDDAAIISQKYIYLYITRPRVMSESELKRIQKNSTAMSVMLKGMAPLMMNKP